MSANPFSRIMGRWKRRQAEKSLQFKREAEQKKFGKTIFLVYTMGKVGSTTIYDALRERIQTLPVFHVHFLSDHWVKSKLPTLDPVFHTNIGIAESIHSKIKQLPDHRVKIITLVREPLVRDLSDVFENWKGLFPIQKIEELTNEMITTFLNENDHSYSLEWFDTEFRNWTGIDIYSLPFDTEKGYSIYQTETYDILVIKLEHLNLDLKRALNEFIGLDIYESKKANTSENKDGKELYSTLMKGYKADRAKLDRLYDSQLVKHFYSEKEIAAFRERWQK